MERPIHLWLMWLSACALLSFMIWLLSGCLHVTISTCLCYAVFLKQYLKQKLSKQQYVFEKMCPYLIQPNPSNNLQIYIRTCKCSNKGHFTEGWYCCTFNGWITQALSLTYVDFLHVLCYHSCNMVAVWLFACNPISTCLCYCSVLETILKTKVKYTKAYIWEDVSIPDKTLTLTPTTYKYT